MFHLTMGSVSDSPTLSRLLESPAKQLEPTVLFSTYVKKEPVEEEPQPLEESIEEHPPAGEIVSNVVEEVSIEEPIVHIKTEAQSEEIITKEMGSKGHDIPDVVSGIQMEDLEIEIAAVEMDKTAAVATSSATKIEIEELEGEKEEPEHSSLNTLQDSDTMEDQQSITELDCQAVNMIVAGGGVISVSHDTSSEHLEEVTSSDIQHKDDSEAAESMKEDSLDDVSEEMKEVEASVSASIEDDSCQTVEPDALNNCIIGSETPKDNYVVQLLCSTPENVLEEEAKTPELKESQQPATPQGETKIDGVVSVEGAVVEVGEEEVVSMDGTVMVDEDDTIVHAVEVLVSTTSSGGKEEDLTEDGEPKETVETPDSETHEDSQEEDEVPTPKPNINEEIEREDKDGDKGQRDSSASTIQTTPKIAIESKPESPSTTEDDSEGGAKRPAKRRLISGSVCSDSKPSSPACHMLEDSKEYRSWKKSIMLVYNRLATHKFASIFLRPITNEQAPAYDTVIHRPVDLSTIKKRIETGELRTTVDFQRDLLLMFQNAIMYNNCRTHVYEMASIMQNECMQHIELMVEAMGEGVPWRRDPVNVDKLHTRGRGEAPKRKRGSMEDSKSVGQKRRKEASN
ncbi:Bromodomain-containing protein 8 [Homalodisca vitripennis]|nr:Bromodomain-containing protein 8 [Homalodisca vitripennis]